MRVGFCHTGRAQVPMAEAENMGFTLKKILTGEIPAAEAPTKLQDLGLGDIAVTEIHPLFAALNTALKSNFPAESIGQQNVYYVRPPAPPAVLLPSCGELSALWAGRWRCSPPSSSSS